MRKANGTVSKRNDLESKEHTRESKNSYTCLLLCKMAVNVSSVFVYRTRSKIQNIRFDRRTPVGLGAFFRRLILKSIGMSLLVGG